MFNSPSHRCCSHPNAHTRLQLTTRQLKPAESDHFATLDSRGENQDTCGGDSGGGLFIPNRMWPDLTDDPELDEHMEETSYIQDVLVGITSYGDGSFKCGEDGTYGIYTDVYYWKDWIEQTIAANS